MDITFTRTTTYTLSVDDDDDAMLAALAEKLAPVLPEEAGDSLHAMIEHACQWDVEAALEILAGDADIDSEDWESVSWDIDGIEPSEDEEEAEALT